MRCGGGSGGAMDGCFDMMHYGHCNALRQARALGDELIVGVVSDDEITANKGPPVTPLHERSFPIPSERLADISRLKELRECQQQTLLGPGPDSWIVYIDGAFDLFHAGHVEILQLARGLGDFLLVGIHTDQTISSTRGPHRPIMNLHERSLSVLACRYVDEVIIGAPWDASKDMITTFNISLVAHGTIAENMDFMKDDSNPYAVPMAMGIYRRLKRPMDITTGTIIRRIVANHEAYQKRIEKEASEK